MAADAFINYVKNLAKDLDVGKSIDVGNFFKSYFSSSSPIKIKFKYCDNVRDSIDQARNCIIANLNLNTFFQKKSYLLAEIQPIYTLLSESKENANDNLQAQIIFLLHLSKAKLDCTKFGFFEFFFSQIKTIQLNTSDFPLKDEFASLFHRLKNNKLIQKIIRKVVKLISGKEINLDFNFLQIAYFESGIDGLNGFAGLDKIYLSLSEQRKLRFSSVNYLDDEKLLILKLNFLGLSIHEMCHVILRKTLNDFNISSPKLFEVTNHTASYDSSLIEAGIFAENELFNGRINWKKSATSSKLNIPYCSRFFNDLLDEQEVSFDIKLAGVELNSSQITIMAVDYDYDFDSEPLLTLF